MRIAALISVLGLSVLGLACHPQGRPAATPETTAGPTADAADRDEDTATEVPAYAPSEPPLVLQEVAPGIVAALQPTPRRFADSNAVLIATEAGLAVIDGPQRLTAVDWLADKGTEMTEGPRRVLVTTHWHLDHSIASAFLRARFSREGQTVEHWGAAGLDPLLASEGEGQRTELREALPPALTRGAAMQQSGKKSDGTRLTEEERAQLDEELAELQARAPLIEQTALVAPTDHATEVTPVSLGSRTLELIPLRAHTEADLVIYIPEAKVLITGDVVDDLPFGGHGRPRSWLLGLKRLQKLDVETVIPGHGGVLGPEAITLAVRLWEVLLEQGLLSIQRGETPEARYEQWQTTKEYSELRAALVVDGPSERAFDKFIPEGLARAVADLNGEL